MSFFSQEYKACVYKTKFRGCHYWDADRDTYLNASFDCPSCTDCNDFDSEINPAAVDADADSVDENCNGKTGEMKNSDSDSIPDIYERAGCGRQGTDEGPVDYDGCWYSTGNGNLVGWG
jgi:hypothetical protein